MNCDYIAPVYRFLEYGAFGPALWQRRIAYLDECRSARRVLIAGEGDGRFLQALLDINPAATVDCYDASQRMIEQARRRCGVQAERVRFLKADLRFTTLPEAGYDLIVTNFFLDCFDPIELKGVVESLAGASRPSARFLVSEFQSRTRLARLLIRGLYLFFRLTTGLRTQNLADYRRELVRHGFRLARQQEAMSGLLVSQLWIGADFKQGANPGGVSGSTSRANFSSQME